MILSDDPATRFRQLQDVLTDPGGDVGPMADVPGSATYDNHELRQRDLAEYNAMLAGIMAMNAAAQTPDLGVIHDALAGIAAIAAAAPPAPGAMPDESTIENHWPHVAALGRTLKDLDGKTFTVGVANANSEEYAKGREIVRLIRVYENASGTSWRS